MNDDNLRDISTLTTEEQREFARKGGIASGKARREKKQMQQVMETLLNLPLRDEVVGELKTLADAKKVNVTAVEAVCLSMIRSAIKGNVRAAEFVKETSEEHTEKDARGELDALIDAIKGAAEDDTD